MSYRHTQTGWLTLGVCGVLLAFLVGFSARVPEPHARMAARCLGVSVILIYMVVFGSLTVMVNSEAVTVQFGLGVIRKRIRLADVASCRAVRSSWWWGWGIRLIPDGWLYNVSGLDAVELTMKNGHVFRIGTDEPQRLAEFIQGKLSGLV
jgi:hypothetical protein